MTVQRNITVGQSRSKPLLLDIFTPDKGKDFETLVFFHGTKGFKDWGAWPLMHQFFNHHGLALVTVNFSHNGVGGPEHNEFTDPEGFAQNTVSLELHEMKQALDWLQNHGDTYGLQTGFFHILGHSRAGGEVLVYANQDARVDKVIAWAPITDFKEAYATVDLAKWKADGKIEIPNLRTGEILPLNYSFIDDLQKNAEDLNIMKAASILDKPLLLIHGEADESVPMQNSEKIYESCLHALIIRIPGANHTFGISHPWPAGQKLPSAFITALDNTIEFINA